MLIIGCHNNNNTIIKKDNLEYTEEKLNSPTKNKDAEQYYNKGYNEFHNENYYGAIALYKKAIELDSNYTDAIDNCALSFRRLNILDSAEFYYKLSIRKLPINEVAWNNLGLVYTYKNDYTKAKLTYKELLQINPNCADGSYGLAEVYLRENNNDSGIKCSLKAYDIWKENNPTYAGDALFYAGMGYLQKGNNKIAKEYFERAKKLGREIRPEIEKEVNRL